MRELKRLAVEAGAEVFERTRVMDVRDEADKVRLTTPRGEVVADRVVIATNAQSHHLPRHVLPSGDQWPFYAYQIATEPLSKEQWDEIGWRRGCLIENNLQLFHYLRPSVDGRIVFGGGALPASDHGLTRDYDPRVFAMLERDLRTFFPSLAKVRITHRWGGAISLTADLLPHIGFVDARARVLRVNGCWGHGLAIAHLHGQLITDLIRGDDTELTEFWVVRRTPRSWPPGPARTLSAKGAAGFYQTIDTFNFERALRRPEPAPRHAALTALKQSNRELRARANRRAPAAQLRE